MVRLAWVNEQTTSHLLRTYRSKLCLLYLLWAWSPAFPPRNPAAATEIAGVANSTGPFPPAAKVEGGLEGVGLAAAGVPAGVTLNGEGEAGVLIRRTGTGESPVTPPFDPASSFALVPSDETQGTTASAVLSSTPSSLSAPGLSSTPALSAAPSAFHSSSSSLPPVSPPEAAQEQKRSEAFDKSPLPLLTPLTLTLLHLHTLILLLQPLILAAGDSLSKRLLASPLPPSFPSGPSTTAVKRLARWRWRLSTLFTSGGPPLLVLLSLGGVLLGAVVADVVYPGEGVGWNAAPLGGVVRLRLAQGFGATREAARVLGRVGGVGRWIVGIEILATLLPLITSLLPVLLPLQLLPSSVPLPRFLLPTASTSPHPILLTTTALHIPLPRLLHLLAPLILPVLTLLQTLLLLLSRYPDPSIPIWRRWLSLDTLVLLNALLSPLDSILVAREKAALEVERVAAVVGAFGSGEAVDNGGRASGKERKDDEWVCCICFEGTDSAAEVEEKKGRKGWGTRCDLPCGHGFHAAHLAAWFATQSFCPTCHRDARLPPPPSPSPSPSSAISPSSSAASAASPSSPAPAMASGIQLPLDPPPPPAVQDSTDVYPGAAAAMRRARAAQLQAMAPPLTPPPPQVGGSGG